MRGRYGLSVSSAAISASRAWDNWRRSICPAPDSRPPLNRPSIRSAIRTGDELVRYGGDEFLLLFHDMPRNALKKKLESIRAAVENLEFPEYPGLRITVSIGGAHAVGPLADTIQKADQALYHAKAAKNRTVLYKEDLQ